MKICFVSNCYAPRIIGGAEIIMQAQAEGCHKAGHDVFVITLNPDNTSSQDMVNGINVYREPTYNVYWPFVPVDQRSTFRKISFHIQDVYNSRAAESFFEIIKKEQPDVVVTHNLCGFSVSIWGELKQHKIPVIHVLHDYYLMCPSTTKFHKGNQCGIFCHALSLLKRKASENVSVVVGVSEFVLNKHLQNGYFPYSKCQVIYNGRSEFGCSNYKKDNTNYKIRLGFLGRVEEVKGVEVLLKALQLKPNLSVELHIAGRAEPDYLSYLKASYADMRVAYLGFINPAEFYEEIDILVFPSLWDEPLPGVVYEPWEFGVPVIASNVGGVSEMIQKAGVGWLVKPNDAVELADKLESIVLEKNYSNFSEQLQEARKFFSPERMCRELLDIIHSVVNP